MYVCMYVCLHTYIHTYIHTYVHVRLKGFGFRVRFGLRGWEAGVVGVFSPDLRPVDALTTPRGPKL